MVMIPFQIKNFIFNLGLIPREITEKVFNHLVCGVYIPTEVCHKHRYLIRSDIISCWAHNVSLLSLFYEINLQYHFRFIMTHRNLHLFWLWIFQLLMGPMVKQWNLMKSIQSLYSMVVNQSRWLFRTIVFVSKEPTQHTLSEIAIASTKRIFTVVIPMTSTIKWITAFLKLKTWKANSLHERFDFIDLFLFDWNLNSGMPHWVRKFFGMYRQDFLRWCFCQYFKTNRAFAWKTIRWTKWKLVSTYKFK